MTEPVKRRYRSERRLEQADQTRLRVLDAADVVFRERGYRRASIAAIAAEAGVAEETVYAHFKNKRTLLGELVQRAVRGGDARPVPEQSTPRALADVPDQREQLRLFAADIVQRLERAAPLVTLVGEAARGEPELAELLERLHGQRLRNLRTLVDALAANGPLRLSTDAATETVWALTSPELHQLLARQRGWSRRRYAAWLTRSLDVILLPTASRRATKDRSAGEFRVPDR
jgi:AcrR family transcriptional regulator